MALCLLRRLSAACGIFLAAAAAVLPLPAFAVEPERVSPGPRLIVPEGNDPHRALLSQCIGCHPDGVPTFWLLIPGVVDGGRPVTTTRVNGSPAPQAPGGGDGGNPHDAMECAKCHKRPVAFGKVTGGERELVKAGGDLSDFCLTCHADTMNDHFPRSNLPGGKTTCLTCHKVHGASAVPPALRDDYYTFIKDARDLNPHGGDPFCMSCHSVSPNSGDIEFYHGEDYDKLCVRCHAGLDHHPSNRAVTKDTWKMEFLKYPLSKGKLACVSCHDPHGGKENADGGHQYSLRGAPYKKLTDFCFKCHEEKAWGKLNAHDQMASGGIILRKACVFCHVDVPDTSSAPPSKPEDFQGSLTDICLQCHQNTPHPEVDHLVSLKSGMAENLDSFAKRRDVLLPLDFDRSITCVTCHNPHEKGLVKGPAAVGADERARLRLTTFNEICTPCHGRH